MKESKPKPRYETEQEILDAIESAHKRADEAVKNADEFDELKKNAAKAAYEADENEGQGSGEFWRKQMNEYKMKAERNRVRASRIREITIKGLKDKLAAFRTETMHFMAGDNSVPR
jgi:hypothetical protein